ncbi:ABC-2 family transporter protein [Candidatus Gottesmanbacteria bacterium]|nr:ABC-2 family transporter protein [Candidatus Gottesmanbacteria bacterium]
MTTILKYFRLWIKLTMNSFLSVLSSRFSAGLFLLGKSLRFVFFGVFLWALFTKVTRIAEYSFLQAMFFYLTFTFIDTVTQLFFREVYRFRQLVVTGDFDLVLVKPTNPLFRALAGGADPLDVLMLIPYVGMLLYLMMQFRDITILHVVTYVLLVGNGLVIAAAFHILVLAFAIMTTEVDHAVMIYRDLTSMGRVPVDIYRDPLRSIITFILPVGIMMTFPAKGFLGMLSPWLILLSLLFGAVFFIICLRLWRFALTQYASASS